MNEKDYVKGYGRAIQFSKRIESEEFRQGFLNNTSVKDRTCQHCLDGKTLFKIKHQYIHYENYRILVCEA